MKQQTVSILHYAGPPVIGGVESTIKQHAILLSERGFAVKIIAGTGAPPSSKIESINIDLLDSRHPPILAIGSDLADGRVSANFYMLRDAIIEQLQPQLASSDYVIVHNVITLHKNLPFTAALHELSLAGIPLIAWCHDFAWQDELYTSGLFPGYPWELMSQPWEHVHYVVVSHNRRQRLAELLGLPEQEIEVITPGVDLFDFLGVSAETKGLMSKTGLIHADPLLLLPARITRRKNIEYALEVTASLRRRMPSAGLVITGPPGAHNPTNIEYLETLLELRRSLHLADSVVFLSLLGAENKPWLLPEIIVAELFRLSDGLLFPSKREGFGIPVLEAGLARLPVFAADIPPVRESSGNNALLFNLEEENPQSVAGQIADFLLADQAYLLRKRIKQHFTWQAILDTKIIPLFERMRNTNE